MQLGGIYARMVQIQTQVGRNLRIDAAIDDQQVDFDLAMPIADDGQLPPVALRHDSLVDFADNATACPAIVARWTFACAEGETDRNVAAVCCFPATRPDEFISLRATDRQGDDRELGVLRRLADWPSDVQELVRAARSRSYFLRRITGIEHVGLDGSHLNFRVHTEQGPIAFTMRWNQGDSQDFGERGKVLVDLDENHYLVPDVEALSARDRELLGRFVY